MGVTVTEPGPEGHRTFFVSFRPTRADWPAGRTDDEERALGEHAQTLSDLADAGTCVIAGPCLDFGLGIALYDGLALDEAVAQLESDPMVVAGYFSAELRAMRLSFERDKPASG